MLIEMNINMKKLMGTISCDEGTILIEAKSGSDLLKLTGLVHDAIGGHLTAPASEKKPKKHEPSKRMATPEMVHECRTVLMRNPMRDYAWVARQLGMSRSWVNAIAAGKIWVEDKTPVRNSAVLSRAAYNVWATNYAQAKAKA